MEEKFLHFIWQNKLFVSHDLYTTDGLSIEIIDLGKHNTNSGPDFLAARINIDNILWVGNVEIHLSANLWNIHKHDTDPAYNNVILHVVLTSDETCFTQDKKKLNCLQLNIDKHSYQYYKEMMSKQKWIPCEDKISDIDDFYIEMLLERISIERLNAKAETINQMFKFNHNSWEETFYQTISRYFGLSINTQAFEQLARSLPLKFIAKEKNSLFNIEAMLFGQAGFLDIDNCEDEYFISMKKEYIYQKHKYKLKTMDLAMWKFLRLRPVNFPTIRIAQLAALLYNNSNLFSKLINAENTQVMSSILNCKASVYWDTHYVFGKTSEAKPKVIGHSMCNLVIINAIIPMMFFYGMYLNDINYKNKALDLLSSLPAEKNNQISKWKKLGLKINSAIKSQALIHLKNNYCDKFQCLSCELANQILKKIWKKNN